MNDIQRTCLDIGYPKKEFTIELQTNDLENRTRLIFSKYDKNCTDLLISKYFLEDDTETLMNNLELLLTKHKLKTKTERSEDENCIY